MATCAEWQVRTYIPQPRGKRRTWTDKPASWRRAVTLNRRRTQGAKSKRLQKRRSEQVERSFAHVCETGGARRTWLRGLVEVSKRYLLQVAARNLGLLMRKLFGVGKPRTLQGAVRWLAGLLLGLYGLAGSWLGPWPKQRAFDLRGTAA